MNYIPYLIQAIHAGNDLVMVSLRWRNAWMICLQPALIHKFCQSGYGLPFLPLQSGSWHSAPCVLSFFMSLIILTHRLSNCSPGISELRVKRRVDKTRQEAESWAFKPESSGIRYLQVALCQIWLPIFSMIFSGLSSHSALWEPLTPLELWVLALKSKE